MTDLFSKFNAINLQLQGEDLNLIITKSVTSNFLKKCTLWKQNFGCKDFSQFPILWDFHEKDEAPLTTHKFTAIILSPCTNGLQSALKIFYPKKSLNGSRILLWMSKKNIKEEMLEFSDNKDF